MLNVFHTGSVFFLASYIKDNFNGNHLVNTVFYKVLANLFKKKKTLFWVKFDRFLWSYASCPAQKSPYNSLPGSRLARKSNKVASLIALFFSYCASQCVTGFLHCFLWYIVAENHQVSSWSISLLFGSNNPMDKRVVTTVCQVSKCGFKIYIYSNIECFNFEVRGNPPSCTEETVSQTKKLDHLQYSFKLKQCL